LNEILPEHNGRIILPGFEELSCLLANDIPYKTAQRLLGFYCEDEEIISDHSIENIAINCGKKIREYINENIENIDPEDDFISRENIRQTKLPPEIRNSIEDLIKNNETEQQQPPEGLSHTDWERINYYLKNNDDTDNGILEELSNLGPKPQPGELLIFIDEILVNNWNEPKYLQHLTGALLTTDGIYYLSGENIVEEVKVLVDKINPESITVIADGASWITKEIYNGVLEHFKNKKLILDWYHLRKKCKELLSMVCFGKKHKNEVLTKLMPLLWNGKVEEALSILESLWDNCRNEKKLSELINYITKRQNTIPNYSERRKKCLYIGSAIVEKANDLLVARRQKHSSMQWTRKGGDALLALKTIQMNQDWDDYWLKNNAA
jgi:hypothetical protein